MGVDMVDELRAPGRDRCFIIHRIYKLTTLPVYDRYHSICTLSTPDGLVKGNELAKVKEEKRKKGRKEEGKKRRKEGRKWGRYSVASLFSLSPSVSPFPFPLSPALAARQDQYECCTERMPTSVEAYQAIS